MITREPRLAWIDNERKYSPEKKNKNSSIPVKEELVERVATPLDRVIVSNTFLVVNRVLSLLYTYLRVLSLQVILFVRSGDHSHIRLDPGLLCLLPGRWGHGLDHVLVTLFLIGHRHGPFDPGVFFLALLRKSINSRWVGLRSSALGPVQVNLVSLLFGSVSPCFPWKCAQFLGTSMRYKSVLVSWLFVLERTRLLVPCSGLRLWKFSEDLCLLSSVFFPGMRTIFSSPSLPRGRESYQYWSRSAFVATGPCLPFGCWPQPACLEVGQLALQFSR